MAGGASRALSLDRASESSLNSDANDVRVSASLRLRELAGTRQLRAGQGRAPYVRRGAWRRWGVRWGLGVEVRGRGV